MSVTKIRCLRCMGRKVISGMGGITKDCPVCEATGKVDVQPAVGEKKAATMSNEPIETVDMFTRSDSVDIIEKRVDEIELCSLEGIFPGVTEGVKEQEKKPMYVGVTDEFMQAILDEPGMDVVKWKAKYQHVDRLFGRHPVTGEFGELMSKVQRAGMRASYAMQQPRIERKVDIMASMDNVSKGDAEFKAYEAKELAKSKKKKVKSA